MAIRMRPARREAPALHRHACGSHTLPSAGRLKPAADACTTYARTRPGPSRCHCVLQRVARSKRNNNNNPSMAFMQYICVFVASD